MNIVGVDVLLLGLFRVIIKPGFAGQVRPPDTSDLNSIQYIVQASTSTSWARQKTPNDYPRISGG